jgi:glycosyltransferase involved in cell wall biosynthesis
LRSIFIYDKIGYNHIIMTLIAIEAARPNRPEKTGTEWYGYHLIQEMKKIADPEDRFILYTNAPLHSGLEAMPNGNWEEKILKWPLPRFWTQGLLSLEMLFHPPDVLFIPAHAMPFIHPDKTVVTLHDVGFERHPDFYSKPDLWYHRWSVKYVIKEAAKIITVSEFSKKELVELCGAPAEKIEVTHLGYDAERYRSDYDRDKIRAVFQKYQIREPYLLYIGRLEKKKNIQLLVEAFGEFKKKNKGDRHHLALVGRPGFAYDKIKQTIERYNLKGWVIETGWIQEEDVPYVMSGAEVFVFPSLYEGFGIPLLEAMACGTPVLASSAASLPEVGGDAVMYFDATKIESAISALEKILGDQALKRDLRERGLARAKNFSWAKTAEKTLAILKTI